MKEQRKSVLVLAMAAFMAMVLLVPGLIQAGNLEPDAPPGPTMKTLDEILPTWSQILPSSERFVLVLGGEAVLDKETGLTWAKDANLDGTKSWQDAINYCANLSLGDRKGWRLPRREDLASLVDPSRSYPALPIGHPFINVQSDGYWSSTEYESSSNSAWGVGMNVGLVGSDVKSGSFYVWPVRGGND